jgi:hypothetical protein
MSYTTAAAAATNTTTNHNSFYSSSTCSRTQYCRTEVGPFDCRGPGFENGAAKEKIMGD